MSLLVDDLIADAKRRSPWQWRWVCITMRLRLFWWDYFEKPLTVWYPEPSEEEE